MINVNYQELWYNHNETKHNKPYVYFMGHIITYGSIGHREINIIEEKSNVNILNERN